MYTIFFTINCVEQLTFSTTFVEHLIFEQLIFFCLKVKLLEIHVRQMIFHDFWFSSNWQNIIARTVSSNNKIVSSRFFEQSNFEQMIMTHLMVKLSAFSLSAFMVVESTYFLFKCQIKKLKPGVATNDAEKLLSRRIHEFVSGSGIRTDDRRNVAARRRRRRQWLGTTDSAWIFKMFDCCCRKKTFFLV